MKKIIDWNPHKDNFTKEGEISLHEKIHQQKFESGNFLSNKKRIKLLEKAENIIGKEISGTIIEIGAGNGYMSVYIAKKRKIDCIYVLECTINGVDLLIRKNFETNNIDDSKYELVLGSFNSIPLVEKFDFVLAFGALHHSSNLQKTLDECYKALKPGGHLIAQEPYSSDETPNSFFVEMKNKIVNVQGLIEIKNKLRDDNFYRKCEYLTASYHAGFDNMNFKKLSDIKSQFSKFFNSKLNTTNKALLILNKSKTIDTKEIPNRWT